MSERRRGEGWVIWKRRDGCGVSVVGIMPKGVEMIVGQVREGSEGGDERGNDFGRGGLDCNMVR